MRVSENGWNGRSAPHAVRDLIGGVALGGEVESVVADQVQFPTTHHAECDRCLHDGYDVGRPDHENDDEPDVSEDRSERRARIHRHLIYFLAALRTFVQVVRVWVMV